MVFAQAHGDVRAAVLHNHLQRLAVVERRAVALFCAGRDGEADVAQIRLRIRGDLQRLAQYGGFQHGIGGLHRVYRDLDDGAARLRAVQLAAGSAGAQHKVAVGIHKAAVGIDIQHAGLGVKDVAVGILHLQKALARDGHVQRVARAGKAGLAHEQIDAGELRAIADGRRVDAAAGVGAHRSAAHLLIEHIAEGGAAGFIAVGIYVGNVVADDVQACHMGLQARHAGVQCTHHSGSISPFPGGTGRSLLSFGLRDDFREQRPSLPCGAAPIRSGHTITVPSIFVMALPRSSERLVITRLLPALTTNALSSTMMSVSFMPFSRAIRTPSFSL